MKVTIVQQTLPHYRIAFFEQLVAMPEYDITLILAKNSEYVEGATKLSSESALSARIVHFTQKKVFNRLYYFPGLFTHLLRQRPRILVLQNMYYPWFVITIIPLIILKCLGIKIMYWTIPRLPKRHFYDILRPIAFKPIDAFILYGEHGIPIIESYGVHSKKIFVAYNSIDTDHVLAAIERVRHTAPMRDPHHIISMGRLIRSKKFDILLQAFRYVHKRIPDARLTLIGDGPEMNNLQRLTRKYQINQQVHFTGRILNDEDKAPYLLSSSLLVLPGLGGLAINEAFCYNLPVICTAADGTEKQLVRDGINGLYCVSDNALDMAQKIIHILSDSALQKKMSANAYNTVRTKFTLPEMLNGFTNAIRSITNV